MAAALRVPVPLMCPQHFVDIWKRADVTHASADEQSVPC